MKRLPLALALVLLVLAVPVRVAADEPGAPELTNGASIELFGTSFCIVDSRLTTGCSSLALPEVRLDEEVASLKDSHPWRVKFFGITLCGRPDPAGPACEMVYTPVQSYVAWMDRPEIRTLDLWVH